MKLGYTREIYLKISIEQSCTSQLFKVTNTRKTSSNIFISWQLTKNNIGFLPIKITSRKVSKNNVHIWTRQITLKKVYGNNVDFWTSEITSIEVRESNVDFSTIKITLKKYLEMTRKIVEIWSSMYRRNIHVELTWIWRGVPVWLFHIVLFFGTTSWTSIGQM